MSNVSPITLTKDFTTKLLEKFNGDGPLGKLLNSHLTRTLPSNLEIDPAQLALHVQLLAYEYAIQIASEFPEKLLNSLGTTTTSNPATGVANGDIIVNKRQPTTTKATAGVTNGDKSVDKSSPPPNQNRAGQ